jgi:hypothetical protein
MWVWQLFRPEGLSKNGMLVLQSFLRVFQFVFLLLNSGCFARLDLYSSWCDAMNKLRLSIDARATSAEAAW